MSKSPDVIARRPPRSTDPDSDDDDYEFGHLVWRKPSTNMAHGSPRPSPPPTQPSPAVKKSSHRTSRAAKAKAGFDSDDDDDPEFQHLVWRNPSTNVVTVAADTPVSSPARPSPPPSKPSSSMKKSSHRTSNAAKANAGSDSDDDDDPEFQHLVWRKPSSSVVATAATPVSSPARPSPLKSSPRKSPRTSRRKSWRTGDKENNEGSPKKQVSQGLSPDKFYQKPLTNSKQDQRAQELKQTIEHNLLMQEKLKYKEKLESQRKSFRQTTTLKTWPVQDMAMEHLDHLLGKHSVLSQFHGGEYLSSESASSLESSSAAGGKRLHRIGDHSPRRSLSYGAHEHEEESPLSDDTTSLQQEPLWSKEPRIFATEKAQGKRKYLVGHFGRIADWYWRKCVNKHLYEVIREKTPCRLYFDLEFSKKFNTGVDEEALLDEFRQELAADLQEHLGVTMERCHIIDLDSSNDGKFSRHWIVDLDHEGFFEDAPTVGRFVKRLVSRLAEEQGTNQLHDRRPTLAKYLFVQTNDAEKTSCFIDLGVYTRNRLFRCFGSSKYGKPNRLEAAEGNVYPLPPLPAIKGKSDDSSDPVESPTTTTTTLEEYVVANNWEPHARALAATLVVPLGGSEGKRIFRVEEDESSTKLSSSSQPHGRVYQPAVSIHSSKSPLPSLEKFVIEVLGCRGGTQGAIRAWSMEYGGPRGDIPVSITFQMCRNRFCELIGRSHKSNNIFWTIVFDSWTCIQGCHDPDCFGRGAPVPIREDYLPAIQEEFAAWRDEEFEKALLALNLDDLPKSTTDIEESKVMTTMDNESQASRTLLRNENRTGPSLNLDGDSPLGLSDEALLDAISANPELFP